jgi:Tol biopolymer transport system component
MTTAGRIVMSSRALAVLAVLGLLSAMSVTAAPANAYWRPGTTERISVSSTGAQGNDDSPNTDSSDGVAMTPDGRYVAFASKATNLVPGGAKRTVVDSQQIFVRDRLRRTTTLVSVPTGVVDRTTPAEICQHADSPAISDDGRYVAFESNCDNLIPADLKHAGIAVNTNVFVRDLRTATTTVVSVDTSGAPAEGDAPTMSADGHVVAFESSAKNLVTSHCASDAYAEAMCAVQPAVATPDVQVYARDLVKHKTVMVSTATDGGRGNGESREPSISPDGRYVVFSSVASDLVAGDINLCNPAYGTPSCPDVFLRDLRSGHTELVSVGLNGQPANDESGFNAQRMPQAMSADDRYVVFLSNATNLIPNYAGNYGIYVRDRRTGRTERVTVDSTGKPNEAQNFSISRDGRYVGLASIVGLVSCPATSPSPGVAAVHDRDTGALDIVGWTNASGQPNDCAHDYYNVNVPQVSRDGRLVAFVTSASNLVTGDTNKKCDVFLRDRGSAVGTGGLLTTGKLSVAGAAGFDTTGLAESVDAVGDVGSVASALGLDLRAATIAYRPQTADLFVRLELDRMPAYALASTAVVYTLDLNVGGAGYELRIGKSATGPSFEIFRASAAGWTHVANVAGGYGTTGEEVVAAVPLASIGAAHGARMTNVRAASGLGAATTGLVDVVDEVTL